MFNRKLIASISLNHNKFLEDEKNSCDIAYMSTDKWLTEEEREELKKHMESACELLRKAYRKRWESKNE